MVAKDFPLGTRFKNKETGRIIEVIEDKCDEQIWFEDVEYGDLYLYVDEELYKEIYKGEYNDNQYIRYRVNKKNNKKEK